MWTWSSELSRLSTSPPPQIRLWRVFMNPLLIVFAAVSTFGKSATCYRKIFSRNTLFNMMSSYIWGTSDEEKGPSTGFQRWKLYFYNKMRILNKYLMEDLFKHNVLTLFQNIYSLNFFVVKLECRVLFIGNWGCALEIEVSQGHTFNRSQDFFKHGF